MNSNRRRSSFAALPVVLIVLLGAVALWGYGQAWGDPQTKPDAAAHRSVDLSAVSWPAVGAAAIGLNDAEVTASSDQALPMASISKVVTVLMLLEERPLQPGEVGDTIVFTADEARDYLAYRDRGQSALLVPAGTELTQYQMLEGILVGSASNFADMLVDRAWGGNGDFAAAAEAFLARENLAGITMVEPTGIDPRNTATPASLIALGRRALAHPVVAEIVAKPSIDLPGVGYVENTNDLLADPGVVGIKTGTLGGYSLLSAKDLEDDQGAPVRVFVVVLEQSDDEERYRAARHLLDQVSNLLLQERASASGSPVTDASADGIAEHPDRRLVRESVG